MRRSTAIISASVWLLSLTKGALASNLFIFPAPTAGQDFHDKDTIDVSWATDYACPTLQLYCSNLEKRRSF